MGLSTGLPLSWQLASPKGVREGKERKEEGRESENEAGKRKKEKDKRGREGMEVLETKDTTEPPDHKSDILSMAEKIMVPKDVQVLIPRTCEYVT